MRAAATCAYGIARGRHKYVPVGSLLAIHGSQRPGQYRTHTLLPGHIVAMAYARVAAVDEAKK